MIILGADPGIAIAGWGILEYKNGICRPLGFGAARTPADMPMEDRLLSLHLAVDNIIGEYKPSELACEELFWNTNK